MDVTSLNAAQELVATGLLSIGDGKVERPPGDPDLVNRLTVRLDALADSVGEDEMFLAPGGLADLQRCVGLAHSRDTGGRSAGGITPALLSARLVSAALSSISRFGLPAEGAQQVVDDALASAAQDGTSGAATVAAWEQANPIVQARIRDDVTAAIMGWADSWPRLDPRFYARWRAPVRWQSGSLVLFARPDLTIGRVYADGIRRMLLVNVASDYVGDDTSAIDHAALVATLRHKLEPWRATTFSASTGRWTPDAEVTADRLTAAVDRVEAAVEQLLRMRTEPPTGDDLTPGNWCGWCPIADTCPQSGTAIPAAA